MKVRVIANPISGGGSGRRLGEVMAGALAARGVEADLHVTTRAGEAGEIAAARGFDCVVSVGGDGTTNEVANGVLGTDIALAILPLGTANVVPRQLGIPLNAEAVADLIVRGSIRAIDAGRFGDRIFLLGAGAGPDAAIVAAIHANRGKRLGISGYFLPTLRTLWRYEWPQIRVTVDGEPLCDDGHYAIVGNCRFSAGVFRFTPEARLDDGMLDVCVMRNLTMWRLAMHAIASWRPGFVSRKDVLYRKGKHIVFEAVSHSDLPLQVDGDPAGILPAEFYIQPAALRVVAPTP
jgi:YegS/Rv2252/BmrU family lipid kinase